MASFAFDQAEGLRRMVAGPLPRAVAVLSTASATERCALLLNLAASLAVAGSRVLLIDASGHERGIAVRLGLAGDSLLQVAQGERALPQAVRRMPESFGVASLVSAPQISPLAAPDEERLQHLFGSLSAHYDLLLVDAAMDQSGAFQSRALDQAEILVQARDNQVSITGAYTLIKRLHAHRARRSYSVLVGSGSQQRARIVYRNMSQAARRYLGVELTWAGWTPDDEQLRRATQLGCSVGAAFPNGAAAAAFRQLAMRYADVKAMPPPKSHAQPERAHV